MVGVGGAVGVAFNKVVIRFEKGKLFSTNNQNFDFGGLSHPFLLPDIS